MSTYQQGSWAPGQNPPGTPKSSWPSSPPLLTKRQHAITSFDWGFSSHYVYGSEDIS